MVISTALASAVNVQTLKEVVAVSKAFTKSADQQAVNSSQWAKAQTRGGGTLGLSFFRVGLHSKMKVQLVHGLV